jgi:hypothetical protein
VADLRIPADADAGRAEALAGDRAATSFIAAHDAIHRRIGDSTEWMWLDTTNHIDLYDQPAYVEPAVDRVSAWMAAHL